MHKLKLDVDTLEVQSFEAQAGAAGEAGTVRGREDATSTCAVTGGINSCWCTEYYTCDCA